MEESSLVDWCSLFYSILITARAGSVYLCRAVGTISTFDHNSLLSLTSRPKNRERAT